ncbi:Transcription initiation factor TFIID subunit 5 [Malassezia cuniculi]|uniref:Transcription initiation factor TFIID subunit 5 n=1 Tax=Malassezia cuniculi TaxID=948313 RepID=A0AAF0EYH1_9BASI|nr:Transcription initiation factor TFIID subunit 5 [Malassezia cuniculi]
MASANAKSESAGDAAGGATESQDVTTSTVMEYLRARGFAKALAAFQSEVDATAAGASEADASKSREQLFGPHTVSIEELAQKNAPRDHRDAAEPGHPTPLEEAGAQALLLDPTDTARGFAMIKTWCCGSLDIYQPELLPILLPLFIHSYMNLVDMGLGAAAAEFFAVHQSFFLPIHAALLSHIRALTLPSQIGTDDLAQRFRTERYVVKMSPNVFGLLIGWLTDGAGPVGLAIMDEGALIDSMLEPSRRGREAMLKIVNERCRIQVSHTTMFQLNPAELEEGTGLTGTGPSYSGAYAGVSHLHPSLSSQTVTEGDVIAEYNARSAGPQLKLHPRIPLADDLQDEVEHVLREEQNQILRQQGKEPLPPRIPSNAMDEDGESSRAASAQPEEPPNPDDPSAGLLKPTLAELPPHPTTYRTVDLLREVERVRDARKCLRIDPKLATEAASGNAGMSETWEGVQRTVGLPSVCMYTYFDAEDGLTCSRFSQDLTLMAAGFEESYVQLWSLKGERLSPLQSDLNLSNVRDRKTLNKLRAPGGTSTRKLIGHSAAVYGVDFDPSGGSGSSPRHLLSCSADGTARLWNLDTYSALVSYRGHQHPVWDVSWGPLGTYFATASADRSACLWSTERINPLRIYAGHLSDVDCVRFHPNSLYLATGSSDRTCRLWDVQRGACVRLFVGHQSPVSCVRISSDGRYLASASSTNNLGVRVKSGAPDDFTISLWDLASGRRIKKMWGHTAIINELDFSADGAMLVSAGADNTVRCWDVRAAGSEPGTIAVDPKEDALRATFAGGRADGNSSDLVATYHTKNTPVYDVHFSPRNLCLAAGVYERDG